MTYFQLISAQKIHISETTQILLNKTGGFVMEKRGTIAVKVKYPCRLFQILLNEDK